MQKAESRMQKGQAKPHKPKEEGRMQKSGRFWCQSNQGSGGWLMVGGPFLGPVAALEELFHVFGILGEDLPVIRLRSGGFGYLKGLEHCWHRVEEVHPGGHPFNESLDVGT
jgi:hypothetical protein